MRAEQGKGREGTDRESWSGWHRHINTISIIVVGDDDIKKIGLIHSVFNDWRGDGRFWLETDYCLS